MLLDISSWWAVLTTLEKVYWVIAIPSTVLLLIQLILTIIGGDVDADIDTEPNIDADVEGDTGFGVFSFKSILGFFTIFAWAGLACIDSGLGLFLTFLISGIAGTIMMFLVSYLMYYLTRMHESGTMVMDNAIDKTGEVYLRIPAERQGVGKVQVNIQGSFRELDALTDDAIEIPTGSLIQVLEIINNQYLLVTKVNY